MPIQNHNTLLDSHVVPGAVVSYAMSIAPAGWLECDGSEVSRIDYKDLFNAIGVLYGDGDGLTTFNLPDLRGEFVRGWDNGKGIDTGRNFGDSQLDDFKSHDHDWSAISGDRTFTSILCNTNGPNNKFGYINGGWGSWVTNFDIKHRGGLETRPRNISLLYCIKY